MKLSVASATLGDSGVASVILGQSPPSSAYNEVGDGLPFFQGKVDFRRLHPIPRVWCTEGRKFAEPGDILVSVRAPVGDVNVATDYSAIGRGLAAVRPGPNSDPWFLYFALLYSKPNLESMATGSTFASINRTTLNGLNIPFFDRMTQVAIGGFLRSLVYRIEQEDETLRTAQTLKRAAMQTLFTHGLRGEAQKETVIGPMPESWKVEFIGDVFNITQGLSLKGNLANGRDGTPFLRTSNVYWGRVELESISRMHLQSDPLPEKMLSEGDLLVCEGGEIGRAAVWDSEIDCCLFQNHLHCLRPIDASQTEPRFIMAWLEEGFKYRKAYEGAGNRTTIPNLSRTRLAGLSIPHPTADEQREIVSILDTIDRKIDLHRRKSVVLEELFKALLHKLMTGEVRVEELDLMSLETREAVR